MIGRRTSRKRMRMSGGGIIPARGGFTLIEILVGLAVGGLVLLIGFAALATIQDRGSHTVAANAAALEGATARGTLIEWLSGAQLQSAEVGGTFIGLDARDQGLPWDELIFPTRANTPRRTPTTLVHLFIDADPATRESGLVAELSGVMGEPTRRLELVPQATGLLIRYLPESTVDVNWIESWILRQGLPRAVELTLLDDAADPLPPLLRLPIRVPLPTLR